MDSKNIDVLLTQFHSLVDVNKTSLLLSILAIAFNPTAWNIVARNGTCHFFLVCLVPNAHLCLNIPYRIQKQNYYAYFWRQREIWMLLSRSDDFFLWNIERPAVRFYTNISFSLGVYNGKPRFHLALLDQPQKALLSEEHRIIVSAALFIIGQTFVVTSTWALGITGTFLGDYFGILMDHRVEGYVLQQLFFFFEQGFFKNLFLSFFHFRFPFNILRDPMYVGSTMCFAATAVW